MLRVDGAQPGKRTAHERIRGGVREATRNRHDEMAAGDEGFLVRGRDGLARLERREHRAQADHAAGGHDDQVDVVARGQPDERVGSALASGIGRQLERRDRHLVGEGDHGRSQPRSLFGEERSVGARGQRHDAEHVRVRSQHVDRLPSDRSGGTEEGDATRLRQGRR